MKMLIDGGGHLHSLQEAASVSMLDAVCDNVFLIKVKRTVAMTEV